MGWPICVASTWIVLQLLFNWTDSVESAGMSGLFCGVFMCAMEGWRVRRRS